MIESKEMQMREAVMRRVRFIFMMRRVAGSAFSRGLVLVGSCAGILFLVSVPQVVGNMSQLPSTMSYAPYLMDAFFSTTFVVQGITVLALAAGLWLSIDVLRSTKSVTSRFFYAVIGLSGMMNMPKM